MLRGEGNGGFSVRSRTWCRGDRKRSLPSRPSLSFSLSFLLSRFVQPTGNSNGTYEGRHNKNARAFTVSGLYPNRETRGPSSIFYLGCHLIDRRVYRNWPSSSRPKKDASHYSGKKWDFLLGNNYYWINLKAGDLDFILKKYRKLKSSIESEIL